MDKLAIYFRNGLLCLSLLFSYSSANAEFTEGMHYHRLSNPIDTLTNKDEVEVLEFFWYGCVHCYKLDKMMTDWLKTQPSNVSFRLVPAIIKPEWAPHAQAFYASLFNGTLDKTHMALFEAMHDKKLSLDTKGALADFLAIKTDGDPIQIQSQMENLVTRSRIIDDLELQKKLGLRGAPSILINGKYITNGKYARTFDRLIKIVDFLVKKELKTTK